MRIISRRQGLTGRNPGIYGHLPKFVGRRVSYVGYLRLVTDKHLYTFWYMGNPYRHKILEKVEYRR